MKHRGPPPLARRQVIAAIQSLAAGRPELAWTVEELAQHMAAREYRVRAAVGWLVHQGRVVTALRQRKTVNGRTYAVARYRLIEAKQPADWAGLYRHLLAQRRGDRRNAVVSLRITNMSQNTEEKAAPNRPNLLGAGADAAALPDDHPRSAANAARRRALRITERDALGRVLPGSINVNGGRPKGATVTTLARTYTDRAIQLLGAVMEDERSPQAARVTAAQALLDRGWGKAPIQIDLNVRAKFDDFLRDVGVLADHQRDQGLVIEAGVEAGLNGALEDEIEDLRPITDE